MGSSRSNVAMSHHRHWRKMDSFSMKQILKQSSHFMFVVTKAAENGTNIARICFDIRQMLTVVFLNANLSVNEYGRRILHRLFFYWYSELFLTDVLIFCSNFIRATLQCGPEKLGQLASLRIFFIGINQNSCKSVDNWARAVRCAKYSH